MSDPSGLASFPFELLQIISRHLHPQDVKALRATSKQMHAPASPYLFRRLYIALRPKTIAVFDKIIAHPIFSQSVTEIVFDASQFIVDHDINPYDTGQDANTGDGTCARTTDKKCMSEYMDRYEMQERIRSSKRFLNSLTSAAQNLKRLSCLTYSDWLHICQKNRSRWYLERGPMSWDIREACLPIVPGWPKSPAQISLDEIFWALSSGRYLVRRFNLGYNRDLNYSQACIGVLYLDTLLSKSLVKSMCPSQVAKSLLTFKATIAIRGQVSTSERSSTLSAFQAPLASISSLRRLDLTSEISYDHERPNILSTQYFYIKDHYWPHLESLALNRVQILPPHLNDFLARHARTLRHLHLLDVHLRHPWVSWVDVIERMRQDLPSLERCRFEALTECGDTVRKHLVLKNYKDEYGRDLTDRIDCEYRRRHLDILEQWVLLKVPYGYESPEQREKLEEVRAGWYDTSQMPDD